MKKSLLDRHEKDIKRCFTAAKYKFINTLVKEMLDVMQDSPIMECNMEDALELVKLGVKYVFNSELVITEKEVNETSTKYLLSVDEHELSEFTIEKIPATPEKLLNMLEKLVSELKDKISME